MKKLGILLLLSSFPLYSAAQDCGVRAVMYFNLPDGGREAIHLGAKTFENAPQWNLDQGEPPLSMGMAISLAREWMESTESGVVLEIADIELQAYRCGGNSDWYYKFQFRDAAPPAPGSHPSWDIVVTMAGLIVEREPPRSQGENQFFSPTRVTEPDYMTYRTFSSMVISQPQIALEDQLSRWMGVEEVNPQAFVDVLRRFLASAENAQAMNHDAICSQQNRTAWRDATLREIFTDIEASEEAMHQELEAYFEDNVRAVVGAANFTALLDFMQSTFTASSSRSTFDTAAMLEAQNLAPATVVTMMCDGNQA